VYPFSWHHSASCLLSTCRLTAHATRTMLAQTISAPAISFFISPHPADLCGIAAAPIAEDQARKCELVHTSVCLSKKQRLTGLFCERDARNGCGQAAMARVKRHSRVEVATKLAQANDLARQGKLQSEIARTLGVSVMTLHRWRKEDAPNRRDDRIAELQLEISRLRRLVADLLLVKLEEAAQRPKIFGARGRRQASR
jgi:putative transposase